MLWIPGIVSVREWDGGEGGKGEKDNSEGEALLVLKWLLSLPQLSSPLILSFNSVTVPKRCSHYLALCPPFVYQRSDLIFYLPSAESSWYP